MAKRGSKRSKPQADLLTKGRHHDLLKIYNALNWQYFNGKILSRIRWGRKPFATRHHHQSIEMGLCGIEARLITIHRALDRSWVPRFFVKYIVFHEMLHLKHPPRRKNGHHSFHYPKFLAAEKNFLNYAKASRWEKNNLNRLCFF